MSRLQEYFQEKPFMYSAMFGFIIAFFTPTISIGGCWHICQMLYIPPSEGIIQLIFGFLFFASIQYDIVGGLLSLIIKTLILSYPMYFIFKNKRLSGLWKLLLWILSISLVLFVEYLVFYNLTEEGREVTFFKRNIHGTIKHVERAHTKDKVKEYLEDRGLFIPVICENTKLEDPHDFESKLNIYDARKNPAYFEKMVRFGLERNLKYENRDYFCEVKQKVRPGMYYDCIIYFNKDFDTQVCFVDDIVTYINVNNIELNEKDDKEFEQSYFNKELTIHKSYERKE
ncbi:hypothetical protein KKG22_03040 [Patescibacteria group bacterium]|nr:hypothetical protein [Patescibacteria group bacterium]MBU1721444.1 hypothetical protein [Patescibacteria group bacterium]MBU1901304.1 hypothetical protein [Patescibacteria group bacterium]